MTTRIGTLGASSSYLAQLMAIQQRVNTEQSQISSGLKSLDYSGIASGANSLVNFQNEKAKSAQYATNNTTASTRLQIATTTVNSVQTTIKNFRDQLASFQSAQGKTQQNIEQIQNFAFQAMTNLQSYLSTNVDGQYIFGGARTSEQPMQLGFTSLSQFQATYDGDTITYPTTRAADLQKLALTPQDLKGLSVDASSGVMLAGALDGLKTVQAGSRITVGGLPADNATYTVQSHAPTNVLGTPLSEGTCWAATTRISYGATPSTISIAETGTLSFGFAADGSMTMSPNVSDPSLPNARTSLISKLTVGTKFSLNGTALNATAGAWDGAFVVKSIDTATGTVTFANDTDVGKEEKVTSVGPSTNASGLALEAGTASAAGTPAARLDFGATPTGVTMATTGDLTFTVAANGQVTMTPANGAAAFGAVAAGDLAAGQSFTLNGTAGGAWDGMYEISNYDATTGAITFANAPSIIASETVATPTLNGAAVSGNLTFAVSSVDLGQLVVTSTANDFTAAGLKPGDAVTFGGTANHNGTFTVASVNGNTLTLAANSDTGMLIQRNGTPMTLSAGDISIAPSAANPAQIIITSAGTTDFSSFATGGGDTVTLGGTQYHNGTYTVTAASNNTLTLTLNPDAVRLSKFVPQTLRDDVTVGYKGADGSSQSLTADAYGSLTFSPATLLPSGATGETITASKSGAFIVGGTPVPAVGAVLKLKSASGVNDGSYEVVSNDGTSIQIKSTMLTDVSLTAGASGQINSTSWYKGDTMSLQQHVSQDRAVDVGIYASDPAFEKALRGMALIAQGSYGTAGGLDSNLERVNQALYLLNDSLESPAGGTPPFGTEVRSDIKALQSNLGFTTSVITQATTDHKQYQAFLDQRIIDLSQIDRTETITTLLSDSNALQASYQSLAKVQTLSLINYLK